MKKWCTRLVQSEIARAMGKQALLKHSRRLIREKGHVIPRRTNCHSKNHWKRACSQDSYRTLWRNGVQKTGMWDTVLARHGCSESRNGIQMFHMFALSKGNAKDSEWHSRQPWQVMAVSWIRFAWQGNKANMCWLWYIVGRKEPEIVQRQQSRVFHFTKSVLAIMDEFVME